MVKSIGELRFNGLAAYTRHPLTILTIQEYDWLATDDERILGVLTWDRIDHDFGWVALARDERLRYRAVDLGVSLPSSENARTELYSKMNELHRDPDEEFHQGDGKGPPVDFFRPIVDRSRMHPHFLER